MKPNRCLTSTIHIPARGKTLSELEKVPTSSSGRLKPMPKAKSKIKPKNLLPKVVTILKSKINPGDKQGEATHPLTKPNANAEIYEPPFVAGPLTRSDLGIYISYSPNIEPAKYKSSAINMPITSGLVMNEPNNCPVNAASNPKNAKVVAIPNV